MSVAERQAFDERRCLLRADACRGQLSDLDDRSKVVLVVLAVSIGRSPRLEQAEPLNRVIESTPNSELVVAVPVIQRNTSVKFGANRLLSIPLLGTTADFSQTSTFDFAEGRLFNETESTSGRLVCVIGADIAETLFQGASPLNQTVEIGDQPFTVIGVLEKQGSFLGLISFDNQVIVPINAFKRYFGQRGGVQLRVKIADKTRLAEARDELTGAMRRVRAQLPGERDNFSINEQQLFKEQLDPIKRVIALAGLFITGLSLFVGAIGGDGGLIAMGPGGRAAFAINDLGMYRGRVSAGGKRETAIFADEKLAD